MDRFLGRTFNVIALSTAIGLSIMLSTSLAAPAAPAAATQKVTQASGAAQTPTKAFLRRLEFTIHGRGCPICLLATQRRLRKETGTEKAVIQLRDPYRAVIIYDGSVTSRDKLLKVAKGNKAEAKDVDFNNIKDNFFTTP